MKPLIRRLRRFRDQEDGLVMTEFLILLPLLVWTFMALFVYWDAFRTINQAQKAAYSISDLISRQNTINTTFVNGMQTVSEYLMNDSPAIRIRITSVKYRESDDRYYVLFSRSPGNRMPALNNTDINQTGYRAKIPIMADQDSIVIVETEVRYSPGTYRHDRVSEARGHMYSLDVGIPESTFRNFIVTRPRYHLQVCFTGLSCPSII